MRIFDNDAVSAMLLSVIAVLFVHVLTDLIAGFAQVKRDHVITYAYAAVVGILATWVVVK